MTKHLAEVEVVFGSASRGDTDNLSDKDILIVDQKVEVIRARSQELANDGWSVASYTWNKLSRISESGALFVQHLKDEGHIVNDVHGRFKRLLKEYAPKRSYKHELLANVTLARLASRYPDSNLGALLAADLLYVTLRNFGVLRLAEEQIYVFSFGKILENLAHHSIISKKQSQDLLELRTLKSVYRAHNSDSAIADTARAVISDIPDNIFATKWRPLAPQKLMDGWKPLSARTPVYHSVRNVEKLCVAAVMVDPTLTQQQEFRTLTNWIENPRAYATLLANNEEAAEKTIQMLLQGPNLQPVKCGAAYPWSVKSTDPTRPS